MEDRKAREKPVYEQLLDDLQRGDGKLRGIIERVESPKPPSRIWKKLWIIFSRTPVAAKGMVTSDVEMTAQNGQNTQNGQNGRIVRKDSSGSKPDYAADTNVGTFKWWLGITIDGHWEGPQKSRMAKQWRQLREYAMVLKEKRAALSSQVMFAQLTIVQG